jgi:hypothetical protein
VSNIFENGKLKYQTFKKTFFPQMCHALGDDKDGDDMDSEKEVEQEKFKH